MINLTNKSLKALILETLVDLGLIPDKDSAGYQDIKPWIPIELIKRIESISEPEIPT